LIINLEVQNTSKLTKQMGNLLKTLKLDWTRRRSGLAPRMGQDQSWEKREDIPLKVSRRDRYREKVDLGKL